MLAPSDDPDVFHRTVLVGSDPAALTSTRAVALSPACVAVTVAVPSARP